MRTKVTLKCSVKECDFDRFIYTECGKNLGEQLVWSTLAAGSTHTQMLEIMSLANVKFMDKVTFYKIEQKLEETWLEKLNEEIKQNGILEREEAVRRGDVVNEVPQISVYVDGAYAKENKGRYDSRSGVVAIFGKFTKKLLYLGIRNKSCSVCDRTKKGVKPNAHKCYKSKPQYTKDMESDLTIIGFQLSFKTHGVHYSHFIADNDSSIMSVLNRFCDYPITKSDCVIHTLRTYKHDIYKASNKRELSTEDRKVIRRNSKSFVYNASVSIKRCASEIQKSEDENGKRSDLHIENKNACIGGLVKDITVNHQHVLGFHDECRLSRCKKPILLSKECTDKLNDCTEALIESASVNAQYAGKNDGKVRKALDSFNRSINDIIHDNTLPLACRRFLKEIRCKLTRNTHDAFRLCDGNNNPRRVSLLQDDLKNMTGHISGDHSLCRFSFCRKAKQNLSKRALDLLNEKLEKIAARAHRLANNENTNIVEQFFALLKKFLNGQRVNFQERGSYARRVVLAGLHSCRGYFWHVEASKQAGLKKSVIIEEFAQRHLKHVLKDRERKRRRHKTKKNENLYGDDDLRNLCDDMSDEQLEYFVAKKIEKLQDIEVDSIQLSTKDDTSAAYTNAIHHRMSTDFFAPVLASRNATLSNKLICDILYPSTKMQSPKTLEIIKDVKEKFEKQFERKVINCGLFIDKSSCFFFSRLTGRIDNENSIFNCIFIQKTKEQLLKSKNGILQQSESRVEINKNSDLFIKIQADLFVTVSDNAYVAIITSDHVFFIVVAASDIFFRKFETVADIFKSQLIPEIITKRLACRTKINKSAV
jgi:hypothetical protein